MKTSNKYVSVKIVKNGIVFSNACDEWVAPFDSGIPFRYTLESDDGKAYEVSVKHNPNK